MRKISVFDTTISDSNMGNEIIMDSVNKYLRDIFPEAFFFKIPYMEIASHTLKCIKGSDYVFLGGTNSLTSRMEVYKQWGLNLYNFNFIKNVVLFGVGWWQYQDYPVSFYTRFILKNVLSSKCLHSVRDSYTEKQLKKIGFQNIIMTGCPSIWSLNEGHCEAISKQKSDKVLFTMTDYNKNLSRDSEIIRVLKNNYTKLYCWIQGEEDLAYITSLCKDTKIEILPPNLSVLNHFLASQDVDYVGTRLHAGIRSLQFKKRTIIIGIDNRAITMKEDCNLPVLKQAEINSLESLINSSFETKIKIPQNNINIWKKQFIR